MGFPTTFGVKLLTKVRNSARGFMQRHGTTAMKNLLWDREFATGRWDCLNDMSGDCLYPYIEKYARQGSILDLGCGPGSTGNEIDFNSYKSYTGVDISAVAVERAQARSASCDRAGKNVFVVSDIYTYIPQSTFDLIVFGDSIYYVPERKVLGMLQRYSRALNKDGAIVARIKGVLPEWWDSAAPPTSEAARQLLLKNRRSAARRRHVVETIQREFSVIERQLHPLSDEFICVLVFR